MRTVLLHGFTGGRESFAHLGLDALTPELPGHGDAADATGWSDALDALAPLLEPGPVVLAGYSMGARLALGLALRHPDRVARLVLESGTAGIADAAAREARRVEDEGQARFLEEHGIAAFVDRWEDHPTLASLQPFRARLRAQRLRHRASGLASALRRLGTGAMPPLWGELPILSLPVTLLAGGADARFSAEARRMQALLPRAELRILEGCGHAPHLQRPEEFSRAISGGAS